MRHTRIFLSVITLSSLLGFIPAGLAQSLTFTSIDPPGASSTFANGIRSAGSTTSGSYSDEGAENGVRHQYGEEHQDIDTDKGEGKELGEAKHEGTGGSTGSTQVVGYYWDAMGQAHSYLLTGTTFSAINVTGAYWAFATGVNATSQIAGYYLDSTSFNSHGFVVSGGTTSSFDVPLALGPVWMITSGISGGGQIAGTYGDAHGAIHGFVRAGAAFTTIDAPGAVNGTFATGVNDTGQVVGYYADAARSHHGFLRSGSTFTQIDITGASSTIVTAINGSGQIAGYFFDSSGIHGFLRSAAGSITTVDYQGAPGTIIRGTTINGLNDSGQITGEYLDSANQLHGYKTGP